LPIRTGAMDDTAAAVGELLAERLQGTPRHEVRRACISLAWALRQWAAVRCGMDERWADNARRAPLRLRHNQLQLQLQLRLRHTAAAADK
jgi:hypothetical protein